ncbi:hypothetical protein FS842_000779 [Serendipita sp. 407]|nr:hypothetical protein FS842_000779 [Serendipita sp. 407]
MRDGDHDDDDFTSSRIILEYMQFYLETRIREGSPTSHDPSQLQRKKQVSKAKQAIPTSGSHYLHLSLHTNTKKKRKNNRAISFYLTRDNPFLILCVYMLQGKSPICQGERVKPLYCMYPPYPYVPNTASSSFFAGSPVYNFRGTSARSGRKDGMTGRVESGVT